MKREDFVNIAEEHRNICEEVITGRTNCKDIECKNCMFANSNVKNRKNCFYNKYVLREDFGNNNYVDELFIKSCKLFLETFFNDEQNIEKEEVLKIESQEVFDSVAFRIVYQNEKVLKRNDFVDDNIGVLSFSMPEYSDRNTLCLRGVSKNFDDKVIVVSKEQFKDVVEKVRMINEKYGIKKKWRAEKGEMYFYVNYELEVNIIVDDYYSGDNSLYKTGNYFKTREEAELVAIKFREVLKEYSENK